jgi:hypothetical protein
VSTRDYIRFAAALPALVGRACLATVAANSLKLHIDENRKDGTYLWIDPPWQFQHVGELIRSSATCPHHEQAEYESLFAEWARGLRPLSNTRILEVKAEVDGGLVLRFEHEYSLVVPADPSPGDEEDWYDHWYFNAAKIA